MPLHRWAICVPVSIIVAVIRVWFLTMLPNDTGSYLMIPRVHPFPH